MKTTTAEHHNFVCPKCHQPLSQDLAGKGFVRHLSKNGSGHCDYEPAGAKDELPEVRQETGTALHG